MPIVKIIPSKSQTARIETYLKNPQKTNSELFFGNFCDFDNVTESFQQWNLCFQNIPNKRTYYHIIVSFNPKDNVTPEQCKAMADELFHTTKTSDYPFWGTVHTDTEHIHAHCIINNCSITGKSYQSTRKSTQELQNIANEICAKHGFEHSIIDVTKKAKQRLTTAEAQIILKKKQTPWKDLLRYQIEQSLQLSHTLNEFTNNMKKLFNIDISQNAKGELRFHTEHSLKPCPAKRLGNAYSKENLEKRMLVTLPKGKAPTL